MPTAWMLKAQPAILSTSPRVRRNATCNSNSSNLWTFSSGWAEIHPRLHLLFRLITLIIRDQRLVQMKTPTRCLDLIRCATDRQTVWSYEKQIHMENNIFKVREGSCNRQDIDPNTSWKVQAELYLTSVNAWGKNSQNIGASLSLIFFNFMHYLLPIGKARNRNAKIPAVWLFLADCHPNSAHPERYIL